MIVTKVPTITRNTVCRKIGCRERDSGASLSGPFCIMTIGIVELASLSQWAALLSRLSPFRLSDPRPPCLLRCRQPCSVKEADRPLLRRSSHRDRSARCMESRPSCLLCGRDPRPAFGAHPDFARWPTATAGDGGRDCWRFGGATQDAGQLDFEGGDLLFQGNGLLQLIQGRRICHEWEGRGNEEGGSMLEQFPGILGRCTKRRMLRNRNATDAQQPDPLWGNNACHCERDRPFSTSTTKINLAFITTSISWPSGSSTMSHNSQDSIRAELEVLPCSCLRRPQPLCRMHLPQHGLSLQIQHAPLADRAFLRSFLMWAAWPIGGEPGRAGGRCRGGAGWPG